ncbi:MAG: TVP38/TMEM64 family protein [Phyllobacteriaceae bacterium]|nr:TVP38/TMEM64 family protein [Phyllobacteriaceae bacterium]
MDGGKSKEAKGAALRRAAPFLVLVAGLGLAWALGWLDYLSLEHLGRSREFLKEQVATHPIAAAMAFMVIYIVAVAFSVPAASALSVFGGFLFGWLQGGAMVAVSATLGACLLFLAARSAFGDHLRARVAGFAGHFAKGFEANAFSYLLALRLAPFLPFFVVNVAPALFKVRLSTYAAATFLGILPATFAFCYLGQGVESVLVAAETAGRTPSVADLVTRDITLAFAGLALVALIPVALRRFWPRAAGG